MKRLFGGLARALFDLRVLVGMCGLLLSVVMHELFHVIMHWGEITSVHLLASPHAIVEIVFIPTHDYNLTVEELCAYGVSALTLLLTYMLVQDIHDQRDTRSVEQIITGKKQPVYSSPFGARVTDAHLSRLLGVE